MVRVEKVVLVTAYIVKPRKRRISLTANHYHHHHHVYHHHIIHRLNTHGSTGYNRKAELLPYSSQQRKPSATNSNKIMSMSRKPTNSKRSKRVLLPELIFRSLAAFQLKREKKNKKKLGESIGNTMNTIGRSLKVEKKKGFVSKVLSRLKKK